MFLLLQYDAPNYNFQLNCFVIFVTDNSDGRKKRYKQVAYKQWKSKCPQGKLKVYVFQYQSMNIGIQASTSSIVTRSYILLSFIYFSDKFLILKLAKSMEEQNLEADIDDEDINVDDIHAGMLCKKLSLYWIFDSLM